MSRAGTETCRHALIIIKPSCAVWSLSRRHRTSTSFSAGKCKQIGFSCEVLSCGRLSCTFNIRTNRNGLFSPPPSTFNSNNRLLSGHECNSESLTQCSLGEKLEYTEYGVSCKSNRQNCDGVLVLVISTWGKKKWETVRM